MALPFPTTCRTTEQNREGMPPVRRYAAMVGCPEKYLYLADPEYAKDDSYVIHRFRDFQVTQVDGTVTTVTAADMLARCPALVASLFEKSGTLTVINGHPSVAETYLLFWHFVCNFAARKFASAIENRDAALSFIGNFRLEENHYACLRRHALAFGPVIDEMNNFHVCNYVDALMRYDDLNIVMLTSTTDVTGLLERLRVVPRRVSHFFNMSERIEASTVPAKRGPPAKRTKSIKKLAESL